MTSDTHDLAMTDLSLIASPRLGTTVVNQQRSPNVSRALMTYME